MIVGLGLGLVVVVVVVVVVGLWLMWSRRTGRDHLDVVDVVIARYEEDMDWVVDELVPMCNPRRVYVYDKGSHVPISAKVCRHPRIVVVPLPNVGREGHTYLHHIVRMYGAKNKFRGSTLFLPGSARIVEVKWEKTMATIEMMKNGKKKHIAIVCDHHHDRPVPETIYDFHLDEYASMTPVNNAHNPESALEPCRIRPFGAWYDAAVRTPGSTCSSGWAIFAASWTRIRERPVEYYETLLSFVDSSSNPEAAHYLERSWSSIFA